MHPVLTTIIQRLGLGFLTLFVVTVIIFSSIEFLPGDFGQAVLGQAALPETVEAFRRELGLDRPPVERYFMWAGNVLTGDLGNSFSGRNSSGVDRSRDVWNLIQPRLANTLFLASMAALVAVPLSLALGITAALYRNSIYDRVVNATTLTTISFPEFFVGYILILIFATYFKMFPSLANISDSTHLFEKIYRSTL
ncbi:MAG TPA: ABC transporter permease, partial [Oceanospirillaceae bacterium]|nr:ABC transporter permease [Oceanospirillaceae bacterium]